MSREEAQVRWFEDVPALLEWAEPLRGRLTAIEDAIEAQATHVGWCVVCERDTTMTTFGGAMLGPHINLREGMVCQSCGINARSRLLYLAMVERFPRRKGLFRREPALALMEAFSPLSRAVVSRWPMTVLSEYMQPDGRPGAMMERTLADGRRASARHEDMMRLGYPGASLDGIVHNDVLEHVSDVEVALRECLRALKPGGSLVFTMPWFPWAAKTLVRGRLRADGSLEELLPAEYHGDGLRSEGIYTFYNFGADLPQRLRDVGFTNVRAGVCYSPALGFLSNNYRYGDDGLMLPTVLMANAPGA